MRDFITDEGVEAEIDRLLKSKAVKLAKKEIQIKNRRRQYLYSLRCMEKRGKRLAEQGVTMDNIEKRFGVMDEGCSVSGFDADTQ